MLFSINDLTFGYDDVIMLSSLNLVMEDGDRIGLIGANGVGKTTLLRLIMGELIADKGNIARKNGLRVAMLRQKDELDSTRTVWQEMQSVFADVHAAIDQMRALEVALSCAEEGSLEYRRLVAEHDRLDRLVAAEEGYQADVRIRTVLSGMGFGAHHDTPISQMSGGEKTRLALCKLLLARLDLLILDEPTNHLDADTLEWLEEYLNGYKGGLLIVSHDRYFLDHVTKKTWDMEGLDVREYRASYSRSRAIKEELVAAQLKLYNKQQEQVADMLDYVQRNIVRATTSKSAKSRLHRIEGMDLVEKPITYTKPPIFRLQAEGESNRDVLKVTELPLVVGDKTLIPSLSFSLNKGERLAIVGPNGVGKSTLIKTLLGMLNATTDRYNPLPNPSGSACGGFPRVRHVNGHIRYGLNLSIGYYDQENLNLSLHNSVLAEMWYRFPSMTQTLARTILGNLLFTAEDMDKTVGELSGGERAKLGFAILIGEKNNLLFLDEPTNHLDLAAREALETGLKNYPGTVVFVSHDRYFVNAVATRVLSLSPEGAESIEGNYDSYLRWRERMRAKASANPPKEEAPAPVKERSGYKSKEDKRREAKRREQIARIEHELAALDDKIAELNQQLSNTTDYMLCGQLADALGKAQEEQDRLFLELEEWENS